MKKSTQKQNAPNLVAKLMQRSRGCHCVWVGVKFAQKLSANFYLIIQGLGDASVCVQYPRALLCAVSNNKIGSRQERRQQFPACFVKQPPRHHTAILHNGTASMS